MIRAGWRIVVKAAASVLVCIGLLLFLLGAALIAAAWSIQAEEEEE